MLVRTSALLSVAAAASVVSARNTTVTSTISTTTKLKPCVCKGEWEHKEAKCNGTHAGEIRSIMYNGCPTLKALSTCETDPVQSWCDTTEDNCIGQTDESSGQGWVYCDAENDGKPQLPFCTCKNRWQHKEGVCANNKGGNFMYGCPTQEQLRLCEPDYQDGDTPWCETNEKLCLQQEDWDDPNLSTDETYMKGEGWAYCTPYTQDTQLPPCTCDQSDAGWQPEEGSCVPPDGGDMPTFQGCPALTELVEKCGDKFKDETQSYCHTYQARCDEQSEANNDENNDMLKAGYTDMEGDWWSYCDAETQKTEAPNCECKKKWWHSESKCESLEMEFSGCPGIGDMRRCEFDVQDSWCETTYKYCNSQPTDAWDQGWSYCDAETNEATLAPCECKERWKMTEGTNGACTLDNPANFRGCPSLEQIQACEGPEQDYTWCETTEPWCREQVGDQYGDSWVECDPQSQLAVDGHKKGNVAAAIGITFMLTVMFCVAMFIGFLMAYRRYINRHKRGYSQELLEHN